MTTVKLKEAFMVESKHDAFYTGGNVEWHDNILYCQTENAISRIEIDNGIATKIGEESTEDADSIHTFTCDSDKIITSHKSGLLKQWNNNNELLKQWKYIHKGPIARLNLNGDILISGGADGIVRVWNLEHQACIASLKGCQGVVNLVESIGDVIFASGDDGKINSWVNKEPSVVYSEHFSKVTSIAFHHDSKHFVSAGRDKIIILWCIGKLQALKTLLVYESIESILGMPKKFKLPNFNSGDGIYVMTGGERGVVRFWDVKESKEVYVQDNSLITKASEEGGLAITKLLSGNGRKTIGVVSVEQNIILHKLKNFSVLKQFIGFSDEILDITYCGVNESHIAVATNSCDIKLYENATMNCRLLKGHTDLVLALNKAAFNPNLLISSAKDNSIRLWLLSDADVKCVAVGMRHTGSVNTVAFANTNKFLISASQDTCVKKWSIADDYSLNCTATEIAHQKDINYVCVSPNDKIIATASQDKTAKLWSENLTLLGVLKGHRRGVWCVRFSPIDQVLLTSSADCTLKLWSITDLSCLKTIEGHESSVIRAEFITNGMQILSTGGDGLIKLYNLKTSECIKTYDVHEARVWALTIKKDESMFITGGADSTLIKWRDTTEEERAKKNLELEQLTLEEQQLSNYIQNDDLLKALKLALKLGKPYNVLKIVQGVIKRGDSGLVDAVKDLSNEQKETLLKCATDWNMNSRNCQAAQLVLNILINELQSGNFRPAGFGGIIEGALPYTERHFKRITQMMQDLQFINYTTNCMQPFAK